jgi:hypothetical protein
MDWHAAQTGLWTKSPQKKTQGRNQAGTQPGAERHENRAPVEGKSQETSPHTKTRHEKKNH